MSRWFSRSLNLNLILLIWNTEWYQTRRLHPYNRRFKINLVNYMRRRSFQLMLRRKVNKLMTKVRILRTNMLYQMMMMSVREVSMILSFSSLVLNLLLKLWKEMDITPHLILLLTLLWTLKVIKRGHKINRRNRNRL